MNLELGTEIPTRMDTLVVIYGALIELTETSERFFLPFFI